MLEYVHNHPEIETLRGNPDGILRAIDEFASTVTGLVNIGQHKGSIIVDVMGFHKPKVVVELGCYLGYSTILIASTLEKGGGGHCYSVEKNPLFAAVASSLVDLAGLRNMVTFVVGTGTVGLQRLYDQGVVTTQIGMLFLDHHKPSYTSDLKLCERHGLIGVGTVLVADNVVFPGNPPYLEWVRATVAEKRVLDDKDEVKGNPRLVYSGELMKSFEPSGEDDAMEITECVAIED